MPQPNVFEYGNYRSFLQDLVEYKRSQNKYSNRTFAEKAGFKAHNFLSFIIKGRRNLSDESARKIAKAFELNKQEGQFFVLLVRFNQSTHLDEQNELYEQLSSFNRYQQIKPKEVAQYQLYSSWHHIPLYESLSQHWETPDREQIADQLEIGLKEVHESFRLLEQLDLIEFKNKKVRRKDSAIITPPELQSLFIRQFHLSMGELALKKAVELPPKERELRALSLSLSQENFEKFRKALQEKVTELQQLFSEDQKPDAVYHLNIQMFPVMDLKKK